MTSTHGRKIGAFRRSGLNPRPQPPQAAQQPPAAPTAPQDAPNNGTVRIGPKRPSPRMRAHVAAIASVTTGPPPRVPKGADMVTVMLDGAKVPIPSDWMLSFSSGKDRDTLLALEPSGELHLLVVDAAGQLRELQGLSKEFVDDMFRWKFPQVRR